VPFDLTTALQSTYGRPLTSSRDSGDPGHPQVTSIEQGQGRTVLDELSDRLQQSRKSRDPVTSQKSDVMTPRVLGIDAGHRNNGVRSNGNYPR